MTATFSNVRFETKEGVATITLNRPAELNPLDVATVDELHACMDIVEADPKLQLVVIKGEGRAFSAGGDLKKALTEHQDKAWMKHIGERLRAILFRFEQSNRIVIAVIDGLAVAGGVEIMLACDMVVVTDRAKISDGHLNFSLLPGAGGTQRLPRLIGVYKAKDLFLTARMIGGQEAHEMGLATYFWPSAELDVKLAALLEDLKAKSFSSRAAIKQLVNTGMDMNRPEALEMEWKFCLDYESGHPDAHEGLLAFSEKRKPRFADPT